MPVSGLSPIPFQPNSGLVVLPSMIPPASRSRRTNGGSTSGTRVAKMCEPDMVRMPFVRLRSLIEYGRPWSGPSGAPCITASSASRASASARSAVTVQKALSAGFRRARRASTACVSSTGESFLARISPTSSVAGVQQSSAASIPRLLLSATMAIEWEHHTPPGTEKTMGLEQTLSDTLTQAIRDRDARTADVVRMLKTRLQERRTAKGFAGTVDDALVVDVIGAYRRQLQKALAEYEKLGARGAAQAAQLAFEIAFCERFLPAGLDAAALRALVRERVAALGVADPRQVGRLVGDIMKTHKGQVEAAEVKRIAEELLAGG